MNYYTQCKLEKPIKDGFTNEVRWIPSKYAQLSKFLELKSNKIWDNGWKVVHVGTKMKEEHLFRDEYRIHREVTDI